MCMVAQETWNQFIAGLSAARYFHSIFYLFNAWKFGIGSLKGRIMWQSSFLAVIWATWMEKNHRCFEGKSSSTADVITRMRFSVASWASILSFRDCLFLSYFSNGGRWLFRWPFLWAFYLLCHLLFWWLVCCICGSPFCFRFGGGGLRISSISSYALHYIPFALLSCWLIQVRTPILRKRWCGLIMSMHFC